MKTKGIKKFEEYLLWQAENYSKKTCEDYGLSDPNLFKGDHIFAGIPEKLDLNKLDSVKPYESQMETKYFKREKYCIGDECIYLWLEE